MIDEDRAPFVLSILNDSSQAPMCRPVCMLDGRSAMVIVVVIAIVVVVVGRGEVDVRGRQDRRPDGGPHQNRGEERTPQAACAHARIMRVSCTPVNSTTLTSARRDGTGHVKPQRIYLTIASI
jgi:hypothetical protein